MQQVRNILVVEDSAIDREIIKRSLAKLEDNTIPYLWETETLQDGLEMIEQKDFDLILLDLDLPDARGMEVVRQVLAKCSQHATVIILSGHEDEDVSRRASMEGCQDYILKSEMNSPNFIKKIQYALERQHLITALSRAYEEERKNADFKTRFLAQMSHEIRTPLNGIIGMASILSHSQQLSSEDRNAVQVIKSAADSLFTVINDILEISKIESGNLQITSSETDVRKLVEECLEIFAAQIRRKNLLVTNLVEANVPTLVKVDGHRVKQVLLNLLSNAIKYTDRGSVDIRVMMSTDDHGSEQLKVDVIDSGRGISRQQMYLLFDPYRQLQNEDHKVGTGLGLCISKSLAEKMGGTLQVESKVGEGSCFSFSIPFEGHKVNDFHQRADLQGKKACIVGPGASLIKMLEQRGLQACEVEYSFCPQKLTDSELCRSDAELFIVNGVGRASQDIRQMVKLIRRLAPDRPMVVISEIPPDPRSQLRFLKTPISQSRLYEAVASFYESKKELASSLQPDLEAAHLKQLSPEEAKARKPVGIKVLVVDDVESNRIVAERMLEVLNHPCKVVSSGAEALALLEVEAFDLILMDCVMPEMSGQQTTELIRERGLHYDRPIIALTANAFAEDREDCIRSGMDDFIAKPVTLEKLQAGIESYCTPECRRKVSSVEVKPNTDGREVLNDNVIEQLRLLEKPGESAFVDGLIDIFGKDGSVTKNNLCLAIQQGHVEAIRQYSHKLKGLAKNLGAHRLAGICQKIEDKARHGEQPDEAELESKISQVYETTLACLRQNWYQRRQQAG